MTEMTRIQAAQLPDAEIAGYIRRIAMMDQRNVGITHEDGWTLINIIAAHGQRIADRFQKIT